MFDKYEKLSFRWLLLLFIISSYVIITKIKSSKRYKKMTSIYDCICLKHPFNFICIVCEGNYEF